MSKLPLTGIKVIEVGQLLAGPFAGTLLAYFGADVIKVEPPKTGDPIRKWRLLDEQGTSFWWYSLGRNKRYVTANLRDHSGRTLLKTLISEADVLIENFKPGTMENWGLGPKDFTDINPDLIYSRISGYGQTGPNSAKPGYASVTEAFSGFRYLNGFPSDVPVRPNLSLGDSVAGLHAAFGIALALLGKERKNSPGQVVDVALYESMFNLMEGVLPEFDGAREIRQPSGSTITGIVPTNTYLCRDGKHVVIGGNGDSIFKRLMLAINRQDLADDPELSSNPGRLIQEQLIDSAIAGWTSANSSEVVIETLEQADVPVGPIYNIQDCTNDPHYQARGLFETVRTPSGDLKVPAILPKLDATPGTTKWAGGEVGKHNQEVYTEIGFSSDEIKNMETRGII